MNERALETDASPTVVVHAHGNLYVRGWENLEVRVRGDDDQLSLEETEGQIRITCHASTVLRVPMGAQLILKAAQGEASIKGVHGSIRADQVASNLSIVDTGPAEIQFVGGDLNAAKIQGDLTVAQISRFANVKDVQGAFRAEMIGSHLNLKRVQGTVEARANGNANLSLELPPQGHSAIQANGVITCRVPSQFNAQVKIKSHGPITVRAGASRESSLAGSYEATFGEGAATLELEANGPVSLVAQDREATPAEGLDFDFDFGESLDADLGDLPGHISDRIASHLDILGQKLDLSASGISAMVDSAGLSEEQAERIRKRTQEKMDRAQEKIRRAQERAARKIAQAQRKAERRARSQADRERRTTDRSWASRIRSAAAEKTEPVSDQERMMILTMVAEGKISIEEAESLLAALEGE